MKRIRETCNDKDLAGGRGRPIGVVASCETDEQGNHIATVTITGPELPLAEVVAHWRGLLKGHLRRLWLCWGVVAVACALTISARWTAAPYDHFCWFALGVVAWLCGLRKRKHVDYCYDVLDRLEGNTR